METISDDIFQLGLLLIGLAVGSVITIGAYVLAGADRICRKLDDLFGMEGEK